MKTKLLKNSYVLPMTLFCSALTFSPLGVAQAHATTNVVQQAKTVKGTVVDETGEPVIGASVMVKGTSVGCATDLDGNFYAPECKARTDTYHFVYWLYSSNDNHRSENKLQCGT